MTHLPSRAIQPNPGSPPGPEIPPPMPGDVPPPAGPDIQPEPPGPEMPPEPRVPDIGPPGPDIVPTPGPDIVPPPTGNPPAMMAQRRPCTGIGEYSKRWRPPGPAETSPSAAASGPESRWLTVAKLAWHRGHGTAGTAADRRAG
jgi:hypothetical protein